PAPGTRTAAQGGRFPGAFLYHHHQGHQGAGVRHEPAIVPDRARVFLHHSGLEPRLAGGEPAMKRIALALAVLAAAHGAAPAQAPSAIKPEYAVLENGMKVILYPDRQAPTVACRLFYVTGSVHEHAGTSGIAHLLEHMLFKGTKKVGVKDVEKDAEYVQRIDALMARRRTLAPKDSLEDKALMRRYDSLITEQRKLLIKYELWEAYEKAGGTGLNAFTSDLMTAYIVTLPKNKVDLFLWLEADRMQNAVLREFYSERDV